MSSPICSNMLVVPYDETPFPKSATMPPFRHEWSVSTAARPVSLLPLSLFLEDGRVQGWDSGC